MAGAGPMTSGELAAKTKTTERYVREWLSAQAAGGFVTYDAASGKFTLPPEQAMALADEQSPVFLPGFFQILGACFRDEAENLGSLSHRQGRGLARARSRAFCRHASDSSVRITARI